MQTLKSKYPACPDRLDPAQIARFQREGYLVFDSLLSPAEIEQARAALSEVVRRSHALAVAGSPEVMVERSKYRGHSDAGVFIKKAGGTFGLQFEAGIDPLALSAEAAELKIRKLMYYYKEHPCFTALVEHPKIRGIVGSVLGPGSLLFQDMALIKPPFIGVEKPWHQDNAYFAYSPLDQIIGVWLALDEATVENGCMHVIPGAHLQGAKKHFHGTDCEIVRDRLDLSRAIPLEMEAGGAIFFAGMLPHQTPPNRSAQRRRALQFHYRGAGTVELVREEYDKLFAEADGSPASCKAAFDLA